MNVMLRCFMKKNDRLILFFSALLLGACGAKTDSSTNKAETTLKGGAESFLKDAGISDFACDGTGNEYTGKYTFSLSDGDGKCTDNDKEVAMLPYVRDFSCTQSEKEFSCVLNQDSQYSMKGCVSKGGRFKLAQDNDLGYLSFGIKTTGAQSEKEKTLMVGTLGDDDGKARYVSVAYAGKQKKGCIMNWDLKVDKVEAESD